jgi:hypothetical protein
MARFFDGLRNPAGNHSVCQQCTVEKMLNGMVALTSYAVIRHTWDELPQFGLFGRPDHDSELV